MSVRIESSIIAQLQRSSSLSVLTGAGVSAESDIPTFRGADGLWRTYRAVDLATPEAFDRNPKLVWEWYEYRRHLIEKASPNPAHIAIAELEKLFRDFLLITQNVDGLHSRAGSEKLVELHGNIFRNRCSRDGRLVGKARENDVPPRCECGAYLRPDVVWFGESLPPHALEKAFEFATRCDAMIVVGTSGIVHPAASLPAVAKQHKAWILEVNLEATPITGLADDSIFGKAGEILPQIVAMLMV